MQGTKNSETISRGVTAIAMTIAIATLYSAMVPKAQITHGDVLRQQIQTALKRAPQYRSPQTPQESLATLLLSSNRSTYSHRQTD
ncbi:MAG: hypothetical protein ACFB2W_09360 [Leptolyngbyaceae cyanobacterium]